MSLTAEEHWTTKPTVSRSSGGRIPWLNLVPPETLEHPALLDWARQLAAAAERRVAELETRLAYLEGLSVTDELTLALNRRGFLVELARAVAAARRGGQTGAVIICDLDGFKAINDMAGHACGNEALRRVAALLTSRVRASDAVARLGGDEFGLLLVGASAQSARRKCQTLARALAEMPLSVDGSPTPLAASFGVAVYDGTEDEEMLLHRADMAMYAAKRRRSQSALPDGRDAASLTPAWPGCPAARPSECEVP